MSQPSGDYLSHVSPPSGSGKAIAQELVDLVRERGIEVTVCGCDVTAVNTGIHNGALRHLEINLDKPVQHFVCLLHCNELPLRHLIHEIDGVIQGPESFSGPIGKAVVVCMEGACCCYPESKWESNKSYLRMLCRVYPEIKDSCTDLAMLYSQELFQMMLLGQL